MSTDPRDNGNQFSEHLAIALADATERRSASVHRLQEAVCNYVGYLRAEGLAASDVPEAVRAFIYHVRHPAAPAVQPAPRAELLIERMVAWCVDMHYWLA